MTDVRLGLSRRAWDVVAEMAFSFEFASVSAVVSHRFCAAISGAPIWQREWNKLEHRRHKSLQYLKAEVEWDYVSDTELILNRIEQYDDITPSTSTSSTSSLRYFFGFDIAEDFEISDTFASPLYEKIQYLGRGRNRQKEITEWVSCGIQEETNRSNAVFKNRVSEVSIHNTSTCSNLTNSQEWCYESRLKSALSKWAKTEKTLKRQEALCNLSQRIQSKIFITAQSSYSSCQSLAEIRIGTITLRVTCAALGIGECFVACFRISDNDKWQYPIHLDTRCGLVFHSDDQSDHHQAFRVYRPEVLDLFLGAIFPENQYTFKRFKTNDALRFIFLAAGVQPIFDNVFESPRYFSFFGDAIEAVKNGELDIVDDVVYDTLQSALLGSAALAWSKALKAQPPDLRPFDSLLIFDLLAYNHFTWSFRYSSFQNQSFITYIDSDQEHRDNGTCPPLQQNISPVFKNKSRGTSRFRALVSRIWILRHLLFFLYNRNEGTTYNKQQSFTTNQFKSYFDINPFLVPQQQRDQPLDIPPRLVPFLQRVG